MTSFPASLTSLICNMPFAMTSHNGCLVTQAEAAICNDVSRPIGCVRIRSFSSLTFPAHQAATVTTIMVSLHIRLPSRYFFTFSSVFCTILCVSVPCYMTPCGWGKMLCGWSNSLCGCDWAEMLCGHSNSQKAATPLPASCTTQTQRSEVATQRETTCMVAIRWEWSSWQTRQSA